ncbi:MAG TPA: recombinase family protein [Candidatus Eremiobacteraceae bacterium]|nr:recombinase family protein [Candidatus Eremiobacteraceae bacterium]
MIPNLSQVRDAVALYRVSTRQQERKGESLPNQQRSVRAWAGSHNVKIVDEIRSAESGKGAVRLVGTSITLTGRQAYSRLIRDLQQVPQSKRPDAVVIDWTDRWSRSLLEYVAVIEAFQRLNIRMLSIGDDEDLTDPKNALVLHIKSAIAQEQLRITSNKVKEARRSRRERRLWQGGLAPDGYRTHLPDCPGPAAISRQGVFGLQSFSQRACSCRPDVLCQDPSRAPIIRLVWQLLESSPLSWEALAEAINEQGHRRPNGRPWHWNDLYRIGQNPAYCGILATNRSFRDLSDGRIIRRRPLKEQQLDEAPEAIPEPFVSAETFWKIWERRYHKQTRHLPRAKNGASCELTGMLACPACGAIMTPVYCLSSMICGNGKPRKSPRKKYVYATCPNATRSKSAGPSSCANRQRVRVDIISKLLIERLADTVSLSDDAIAEAFALERASSIDVDALETERRTHTRAIKDSEHVRHALTRQLVVGTLTDDEYQKEIFLFRRDVALAQTRLNEIDRQLRTASARPNFERARSTVRWLAERWDAINVPERAEALRLLVDRATYSPSGTTRVDRVRIVAAGAAFSEFRVADECAARVDDLRSVPSQVNL